MLVPMSADQARWEKAHKVKRLRRVNLPRLPDWNYDACQYHETPTPECEYRLCGGDFFDHQTKSVVWAYIAQKGIEASVPGAGKTNIMAGLLCLQKYLGETLRTVIVVQTPTVAQWSQEVARFAPGLDVAVVSAGLNKSQRLAVYAGSWEVLILGYHLMTRDIEALMAINVLQIFSDDVDPILNPKNATAKAFNRLAENAERVLVVNATNLQTRLDQLYFAALPIGGRSVWGSLDNFKNKYEKREPVYLHLRQQNRHGKDSRKVHKTMKFVGYKNLTDFKEKFGPMVIRHGYGDLNDVRMPDVMPATQIWLDMYPEQKKRYALLQAGVIELLAKDETPQQRAISALTAYNYGTQICTGLPALGEPDGEGSSAKLDWLEHQLAEGVFSDQKAVVFIKNIGSVQALHERLSRRGVRYETIWGREPRKEAREASQRRFWEDPDCRVMIGTSAMERGLNLQIANILVFVDSIPNPARMHQLLGRIRRAGSVHSHVFPFYLLMSDTQEERYLRVLGTRQALVDAVWNEDSAELFDRLSPEELLRLITP